MHNTTGRLVSAYIDTQICTMGAEEAAGLDRGYDHIDPLPRVRQHPRLYLSAYHLHRTHVQRH